MLVIRLQRTGRKGHAMFRIVVQDSRRSPSSGKVVARLGSFDPHTKNVLLDKEKASLYLSNGAQPSDRLIKILKDQGIKLPNWVNKSLPKKKTVKNPEKRRSTAPPKPKVETPAEEVVEPTMAEAEAPDAEVDVEDTDTTEESAAEAPAEQPAEQTSEVVEETDEVTKD